MTKDEALKLALEALEGCEDVTAAVLKAITAIREALAQPEQEPVKLWLWKNFVNGRPEYWAFDNAFPVNMNNDDPQTIGEPCGYAWLKPSRQGRFDVSDEEVLRAVQNAKEFPPQRKPLSDEIPKDVLLAIQRAGLTLVMTAQGYHLMNLGPIEAAHGIKE